MSVSHTSTSGMEAHLTNVTVPPNSTEIQSMREKCQGSLEGPLVWAAASIASFLLGFPSNIALIWEQLRQHRRSASHHKTDILKLNLTVMDLIFNCFIPASILNNFLLEIASLELWVDFLLGFSMTGRPLFISCICLDCYQAVLHPITYKVRNHLRHRALLSSAVWAFTLVFGVLLTLNYFHFLSPVVIIPYNLSLIIVVVCSIFILRSLRKTGPGSSALHSIKKKAFQTVFNSLVMMLVFYLPPVVVYFYINLDLLTEEEAVCTFAIPSLIGPTFSSGVMPVMYLHRRKLQCFRC